MKQIWDDESCAPIMKCNVQKIVVQYFKIKFLDSMKTKNINYLSFNSVKLYGLIGLLRNRIL